MRTWFPLFLAIVLGRTAAAADPGDAQLATAISDRVEQLADAGQFSGAIVVTKAGKPIVAKAYGLANIERKTPNTVDTVFNIGSITKDFTKVAIAHLAQAGKLSLDDTVAKHLPGTKIAGADRITIRQLLEHRSGMGDVFGAKYDAAPPSRLRELADFVPLFAGEPLAFEPGTSQAYSNAGYITLGLIVERITGERYREYVAKHVFAPAGMTRSGFWAVDETVPNRATGYTLHGSTERTPNTKSLSGRPSSAGGSLSTAGDLVRFYDALLADKLLSTRWTSWMVNGSFDDARREPSIGVAGGAPGINAMVELDGPWKVVALANFDPPSAMATVKAVMALIPGRARRRPPSAPTTTELARDVAVPAKLVGHLFTVEAKIDGKGPFRFTVDTGSGGMLQIGTALQKTLQLPTVGEVLTGDPSGKNPQNRTVMRAGSVEIGDARFTGVDAAVGDGRVDDATSGVIGLALFASLTVTLDYPKQELRLGKQPLAATAPHVVAFTSEHGVPAIDIDAGGVALKADVDTGSPATLTIPASWAAKLAFAAPPRVVGKGRTVSNEFEIRAADLKGELRVAGFAHRAARVDLVDVFPVANIGSMVLRDYAVTFDLVNRRMALAR